MTTPKTPRPNVIHAADAFRGEHGIDRDLRRDRRPLTRREAEELADDLDVIDAVAEELIESGVLN